MRSDIRTLMDDMDGLCDPLPADDKEEMLAVWILSSGGVQPSCLTTLYQGIQSVVKVGVHPKDCIRLIIQAHKDEIVVILA